MIWLNFKTMHYTALTATEQQPRQGESRGMEGNTARLQAGSSQFFGFWPTIRSYVDSLLCYGLRVWLTRSSTKKSDMQLKLGQTTSERHAPFLHRLTFYFVWCSSLSQGQFAPKIHRRMNCCRESCSGVNWSVPARLTPADGAACNSTCQVARHQF